MTQSSQAAVQEGLFLSEDVALLVARILSADSWYIEKRRRMVA